MNEIIRKDDQQLQATAISKTDLTPVSPTYTRGLWQTFLDFIRQNIWMRPAASLAQRFAEAEVSKREAEAESRRIENEITLLRARQEYLKVKADIRRQDVESLSESIARSEMQFQKGRGDAFQSIIESIFADSKTFAFSVFLSDPTDQQVERTKECVNLLLESIHCEVVKAETPQRGSWFQRWMCRPKPRVSVAEVREKLDDLERALRNQVETHGYERPTELTGASELLTAIGNNDAVVFVDRLLVVKRQGSVVVRSLTPRESHFLNRNVSFLKNPFGVLDALENVNHRDGEQQHELPNKLQEALEQLKYIINKIEESGGTAECSE